MKFRSIDLTRSALMIALLIVLQLITKTSGQYITGSVVNSVLAISSLLFGFNVSFFVALLSPFFAFVLGIGTPIIQIVPIIALSNILYVLIIDLLKNKFNGRIKGLINIALASFIKYLTLNIIVIQIILPILMLPAAKVTALSIAFSWLQLFTALIGGVIALELSPQLMKLIKNK